nr:MAG TPA: hypothetical protein [Caudoviricetes sp.]
MKPEKITRIMRNGSVLIPEEQKLTETLQSGDYQLNLL